MKPAHYRDEYDLADLDKQRLGSRAAVPSAGNAYGAVIAPNLDPMRRPDVLNEDGSHSSLLSGSFGTDQGETLVPGVTEDGRELEEDQLPESYAKTGKHLGVYSSPEMADQAAIAMHNYGAEQMESPSYKPTGWYRADMPGKRFNSREEQAAGVNQFGDDESNEDPNAPDESEDLDRGGNQLFGIGPRKDSRVQAEPDARPETPEFKPPESQPTAGGAWGVGTPPAKSSMTNSYDPSGAPVPQESAAAPAAAAASGGAMPWLAPVAMALGNRMQEQGERQQAKAGMAGEYASQFGFPTYGFEGAMKGRQITNRHGGLGLGMLGNLFRRRG